MILPCFLSLASISIQMLKMLEKSQSFSLSHNLPELAPYSFPFPCLAVVFSGLLLYFLFRMGFKLSQTSKFEVEFRQSLEIH